MQSDGAFSKVIFIGNDILIMEYNMEKISYFAHEGKMARAERTQRRLWIASLVLTVALVATNTAWVLHFLI